MVAIRNPRIERHGSTRRLSVSQQKTFVDTVTHHIIYMDTPFFIRSRRR